MKTLVVYYSKTGTTKKVAQTIIESKNCDYDELQYDEKTKTITHTNNPSDYEHIILLAPVWAFALAEPMKQYIAKHKSNIKQYDLIVTCGAWGLRGCIKNCVKAIGKPPGKSLIFKAKHVKRGNFDINTIQ